MRRLYLDVSGLVLLSESQNMGFFVNGILGGVAMMHGAAIPPHYTILGIPHGAQTSPPRESTLTYHHFGQQVLFGGNGLYDAYILTRENSTSDPMHDVFLDVSVRGTVRSGAGTSPLAGVIDIYSAIRMPIPPKTISGESRAVTAILHTGNGDPMPLRKAGNEVVFDGHSGVFAHTVRYTFEVDDSETPAIVLTDRRVEGTIRREIVFALENPSEIETGVSGWHLYMADLPLGELLRLHSPFHADLHHFELIYDLYDFPPGRARPVPRRTGGELNDPGFCGPPTKG